VQRKGLEGLKEAHPERPSKEKSRGLESRPKIKGRGPEI
jgi:hypothetical protein